jgi:predicted nucleotidyltransferase
MAIPQLARDFSEFLNLLNSTGVEYLLVGGYAVGIHGYVRATGDLDIWIRISSENARNTEKALREFGFAGTAVTEGLFLKENSVIRMGVPPMRLEVLTSISGVDFAECYRERLVVQIDGMDVPVISLNRLLQNKRAAGRAKDLADIDNLPSSGG